MSSSLGSGGFSAPSPEEGEGVAGIGSESAGKMGPGKRAEVDDDSADIDGGGAATAVCGAAGAALGTGSTWAVWVKVDHLGRSDLCSMGLEAGGFAVGFLDGARSAGNSKKKPNTETKILVNPPRRISITASASSGVFVRGRDEDGLHRIKGWRR